ncbi:hypothetical protein SynMEDNS5_01824 [Synechococcus sp. MEDNS5]|nr:hypothetical protein SynMEDNS5_01824 [Synechococcus sp. MEDNS5]
MAFDGSLLIILIIGAQNDAQIFWRFQRRVEMLRPGGEAPFAPFPKIVIRVAAGGAQRSSRASFMA